MNTPVLQNKFTPEIKPKLMVKAPQMGPIRKRPDFKKLLQPEVKKEKDNLASTMRKRLDHVIKPDPKPEVIKPVEIKEAIQAPKPIELPIRNLPESVVLPKPVEIPKQVEKSKPVEISEPVKNKEQLPVIEPEQHSLTSDLNLPENPLGIGIQQFLELEILLE